ncbi:cupin domain-containing protein [Jiangella ureilytica]|uniref:Cupin domain-containing protein n=1 Tax=Jiangella ureilytica TaxID=2530374 RepID=A0A4R4RDX8_9ACTN|nr:cupin domain-containing protein [Jiangella ureilytica]TDC47407.1 cupin domain-containing protein [Jiangella ureilytica]
MDKLPVDRTEAERILLGTDELTVLATSEQTGGAIFAVEIRMPPGGGPPVLHGHAPGEVYRVLAGEFSFYVGDGDGGAVRRVVAGPGDVVPLAGNTPHTIRNEGTTDAVAFMVHSPGGPMEAFSRAAAALAADAGGRPSMDDVLELAQRHGIELLGPYAEVTAAP